LPVSLFKRRKDLGFFLLGIWLIAMGVQPLLRYGIPFADPILGLLAIAAGALILMGR
jgi:hypothetical protein